MAKKAPVDAIQQHIEQSELLEYCSLYRAARWIAFNEKPIENAGAHPARNDIRRVTVHKGGIRGYKLEENWKDQKDAEKFYSACAILLGMFKKGELTAEGCGLAGEIDDANFVATEIIDLNYERHHDDYSSIPLNFWAGVTAGKEWIVSQAESFYDGKLEFRAYKSIRVNCDALSQRVFGKPKGESVHLKVLRSLQKLVISMSIRHYGYNPYAKRNTSTEKISGCLSGCGLTIDSQTILDRLREAADVLPDEKKEELHEKAETSR